jgi:hypothetical protein
MVVSAKECDRLNKMLEFPDFQSKKMEIIRVEYCSPPRNVLYLLLSIEEYRTKLCLHY